MKFDIYEYIANQKDEKKKKRLLKYCFNKDLEYKKEGFYPNIFNIFHKKLTKEEILYLSNLYLDYYATTDEKKLYYLIQEKFILKISKNLQNNYFEYKKAFDIYIAKGVFNTEFLKLAIDFKCNIEDLLEYPSIYSMMFATKEERELYKKSKYDVINKNNIEKFYYKICLMCDFDYSTIFQLQLLLNKTGHYIFQMIDKYIDKNLQGKKPDEYIKLLKEFKFKNYNKPKMRNLFLKLEEIETNEKIIKLLLSSLKKPELLLNELPRYIKNCRFVDYNEEAIKIEESLKQKILIFKEYYDLLNQEQDKKNIIKEENDYNNLLPKIEELVLIFLNDDYSNKTDFCEKNNLKKEEFEKLLLILKKYKVDLYEKYQEKIKIQEEAEINKILGYIDIMLFHVENGIIEEDSRREFDILDYFMLFKLPFKVVLEICKGRIEKEKIQKFKSFMLKNTRLFLITPENIEEILKEKIIVNTEFDSNNFPILGSGHVVSREEKLEIINELKKYNIHYYQVYQRAINKKYNIHIKRNIKN